MIISRLRHAHWRKYENIQTYMGLNICGYFVYIYIICMDISAMHTLANIEHAQMKFDMV